MQTVQMPDVKPGHGTHGYFLNPSATELIQDPMTRTRRVHMQERQAQMELMQAIGRPLQKQSTVAQDLQQKLPVHREPQKLPTFGGHVMSHALATDQPIMQKGSHHVPPVAVSSQPLAPIGTPQQVMPDSTTTQVGPPPGFGMKMVKQDISAKGAIPKKQKSSTATASCSKLEQEVKTTTATQSSRYISIIVFLTYFVINFRKRFPCRSE